MYFIREKIINNLFIGFVKIGTKKQKLINFFLEIKYWFYKCNMVQKAKLNY